MLKRLDAQVPTGAVDISLRSPRSRVANYEVDRMLIIVGVIVIALLIGFLVMNRKKQSASSARRAR